MVGTRWIRFNSVPLVGGSPRAHRLVPDGTGLRAARDRDRRDQVAHEGPCLPPSRDGNEWAKPDASNATPIGHRVVMNLQFRAVRGRTRSAAAGAAAAAVWAFQEPLDERLVGCDYSDVAVLGKALTNDRGWWPVGFAVHVLNGALFGLAYHEAHRRWPARPRALGIGLALGEHLALYPLCYFVDRFHPRRGEPGVPPLLGNHKAFIQATWRHSVFGLVLGKLA